MNLLDCCFNERMASKDDAFLETCIEYKIASTRWDREGAFRLLYRAYRRAGLMKSNQQKMKVTSYHLLPTTSVMVARYANQIVSTLSLIEDGELGLPMEQSFAEEVRERRQRGYLLAEASCLADRRTEIKKYLPVFVRLCRLMIQSARNRAIDELLIAVHPRHVRFYTQFLAFEQIADERPYPAVQNQSAVALSLDLKRLEIDRPANYERFFTVPIDADQLQFQPMSASERSHFLRFAEDPNIRIGPPVSARECHAILSAEARQSPLRSAHLRAIRSGTDGQVRIDRGRHRLAVRPLLDASLTMFSNRTLFSASTAIYKTGVKSLMAAAVVAQDQPQVEALWPHDSTGEVEPHA